MNCTVEQRIKKRQKNNPFITYNTLVYEILLDDIVKGVLKPGTRLSQQEVASKCKMSRSPVREAFNRLESEGFLVKNPDFSFSVSSLEVKDFFSLNKFRIQLEIFGVRETTMRICEDGIKKLTENMSRFKEAIERKDIDQVLKLDQEFHDILIEASGNKYLINTYRHYRNRFKFIRSMIVKYNRLSSIYGRHDRIYRLILERDQDGAAREMDMHLRLTLNHAMEHVGK